MADRLGEAPALYRAVTLKHSPLQTTMHRHEISSVTDSETRRKCGIIGTTHLSINRKREIDPQWFLIYWPAMDRATWVAYGYSVALQGFSCNRA